jgi:hypothetical protein
MSFRTTARHADWLSLVEPIGPFLTLPVLRRALPSGLERTPAAQRAELRERIEDLGSQLGARQDFVGWVLRTLLGFGQQVREGQGVPDACTMVEQAHHVVLRPHFVVLDPRDAQRPRLLVSVYDAGTNLLAHLKGERWAASPVDRMVTLCRGVGCTLGLVTDGDRFILVWAPLTGPVGRATWVATVFAEGVERTFLDSFTTLLGARRFFAVAAEDQLDELLAESAQAQTDVTGQLGLQVRRATELLVAAMSRADRDRGGKLLEGITPHTVYEAVVTVLMRIIFLLYAEERRLLPLGDELYDQSYAASTLRDALRSEADRAGEDALEHRATAWPRLLATFRVVYGGLAHDRLRIPAYGGRLFGPRRFPFLEGHPPGTSWRDTQAEPIPIDDRTMLEVLTALQVIETRVGGATEARRLSFRALDVEQIGHVYEGLLDHSAIAITRPTVGLVGRTAGAEPEVALDDLERFAGQGEDEVAVWLHDRTGKSQAEIERLLAQPIDDDRSRLVLAACDNDPALAKRVEPYGWVVRDDLRGLPLVLRDGTIYVTETSQRRDTGTEYTPRELADEVVKHALEPLVYAPGPAEETDPELWKLRTSEEILSLRVCDPAVGSGAFLVAACRYLADRLVEAWTFEQHPLVAQLGGRTAAEGETDDLTIEARRRVAERCVFGVDRDPMAVEMAKLSLWLTTLSRERPFTFIDHALQSGDSLLGITSLEQVIRFHIDPAHHRQINLGGDVTPLIARAVERRHRIQRVPVTTVGEAEDKARVLREVEHILEGVKVLADLVIGAALATAVPGGGDFEERLRSVRSEAAAAIDLAVPDEVRAQRLRALASTADAWLNEGRPEDAPVRHCLHWPLAFPEVFADGGAFDAMVGNPPFLGGQRLTARVGHDVREYAVRWLAHGTRGSADLVAYFFLRAAQVARTFGLLATNTISQGGTREVGLDQLAATGWTVYRAVKSIPWPGSATLEIAKVWATQRGWNGKRILNDGAVRAITTSLDPASRMSGAPHRLSENASKSFQGSNVLGLGFTMGPEEAQALVRKDRRNREVLFPYLNGEDLNSSPTQTASRWVINFFDWPIERARQYPDCFAIVEEKVKPERMGKSYSKHASMHWWQYERYRPELYHAIAGFERVLVIAQTSRTLMPFFVAPHQVYSHMLVVFSYEDGFHLGTLSSSLHSAWVLRFAATMRTDIRYIPSDCFDTFPQSPFSDTVAAAAKALYESRAALMLEHGEGLTKTYNRVHTEGDSSTGIVALRGFHRALDLAVRDSYGWSDLDLGHGFHETSQGVRFTISPAMRTEVLDRLLELNHQRYAEESKRGLHPTKKARAAQRARAPKAGAERLALFDRE